MLFVIMPSASGSLGLSRVVRPLLPPGSESIAIDMLDGKYAQDYSGFRIGGLDAVARHVIEQTPSLAGSRDDIILVSSCAGCIVTLEIAKQMPRPPRRLVLLDPVAIPFTTSRSFIKFHRQTLAAALKLYRHHRRMRKDASKLPKFARFALHMKARALWFYERRSTCKLTVLVSRGRRRIKKSFFSRNLNPEFYSTKLPHKELFYSAQGSRRIRLVLEKALQSCLTD